MKTQTKLNKILTIAYPFLSIALMMLVWHCLFLAVGSEFIFPSIGATLAKTWAHLRDGAFWLALLSTFARVVLCFVLSLLLALCLGVLCHFVKPAGKLFAPVVAFFRAAPTVALMVILVLLSNPKVAPVIVGLVVVFPMLYASVRSALRQVDGELLQMCQLYNVPRWTQIKHVYMPAVTPYLLGELPATLSFTVKLIVSAEILSNTFQSFGGLIQGANVYVDMASLFALTILAVLFATLLDVALTLLAKVVTKEGKQC